MTEAQGSEARAAWAEISELLQRRVARTDFMSWFFHVEPARLDATSLTLSFANDFAAQWVRERFAGVLSACVEDVLGPGVVATCVSRETADSPGSASDNRPGARGAHGPSGEAMTEAELRSAIGAHVSEMASTQPLAPESDAREQPLNPRYRFDTFVIGAGNHLAHAAALSVAESPGQSYNPLFIHGATGLGKTHLLHAIGHYVQETRPGIRVAYATAEQFVTRFIRAIQPQQREQRDRFKAYFRGIDVLLLDDVQFLSGKGVSTQEELFHTFNALHESGKQVVLTGDCPPAEIPKLEDRLRSRFSWGLIAEIAAPDHAARTAILRKRAAREGIELNDQALEEIAGCAGCNVRELEGILTRLVGVSSLAGRPIDAELVRDVVTTWTRAHGSGEITVDRIQHVVCQHFDVTRDELVGKRRSASVTRPRHIAIYLARVLLGTSSKQLGRQFGGRDHSTILSAEQRIDELIREDRTVHDLVEQLVATLRHEATGGVREVR
jgi:chromosomal replication initiator protein